ncbi:MAG: nitroreductase family protein [Lachnospiraceae bacterium]
MDLYGAIHMRKSVRKFVMKAFSEEMTQQIHAYKDYIFPLYSEEPYTILLVNMLDEKRIKFLGAYAEAPYYILFCGSPTQEGRMNAGFLLEKIALYLTEKGIGSCYQGMVTLSKGKELIPVGQELLMVLACGYPKGECQREASKAKRLPLEQILVKKEEYGSAIDAILQAGRLAPSAMNRQPWRLVVQKNKIHIFMKKTEGFYKPFEKLQEIDIGILLAHFKLTADELWMQMDFKVVDSISEREFKNTVYVTTAFLSNFHDNDKQ